MRVFILGAGASIHAGYPSAAEMGNRLADWINSLPVDSVYHYYLDQVVNLYGALDNFETVLTDLMTCPSGSRAATLGAMRPLLLDSLQEAIRDYFNVIRSGSAPLYDELANLLLPGDTIITFNYDLGIERALRTTWLWDIQRG